MNEIYFILLMFISLPICSAINVLEVWKPSYVNPKSQKTFERYPQAPTYPLKYKKHRAWQTKTG